MLILFQIYKIRKIVEKRMSIIFIHQFRSEEM